MQPNSTLSLSLFRLSQIHYFIFIHFQRCIHQYNAAIQQSEFKEYQQYIVFLRAIIKTKGNSSDIELKSNSDFVPSMNLETYRHSNDESVL